MFYGILAPNFGDYSDPRVLADLAGEAEETGWDGFFVFDHLLSGADRVGVGDPWISLAAIATRTNRIRIGPMVTPLARRRPWKLARETVTLDRLAAGRLTLGVGLGGPPEREFETFGETGGMRVRAGMLDESLDVLTGLWTGESFSYDGAHYRLRDALFQPPPVQSPRIPIWVGAKWRNRAPLRRAARWDGVFPIPHGDERITPDILREVVAYVKEQRANDSPFDVIVADHIGERDRPGVASTISAYAEAGLTWWLERVGGQWVGSLKQTRSQIRRGPP